MELERIPSNWGVELPELAAVWTALENALSEVGKAREALDKLTHHEEQYPDGETYLAYNADFDKYMLLYTKLAEAERAASAAQTLIQNMEYQRRGGLNGILGWAGELARKGETK